MLRRVLITIFTLFILAGCSLPGTQSEGGNTESGTTLYTGSGFTMDIPNTWNTTPNKVLPIPRNGAVVLTAVAPEIKYGFANNILIMQDVLNTPVTSKHYSEMNQLQTTRNYLEYTKTSEDSITFPDTDSSTLYVFEARYNTTTQRMKFIQTAKVCGTTVYLLHAAISLDKEPENYIKLFETFTCK